MKSLDEEPIERIHRDLQDSYDEEVELELEDRIDDRLAAGVALGGLGAERGDTTDRARYFRELFRLQAELVKLQDWVVRSGHKVVILFEGRDAAGKGGVIKRISQRLNPRVCRVAALPAPNDRERTQWYFQRYATHLPAGGEIVLFDRSWYNRAGVERVMGFYTDDQYEEFFGPAPEFERMLARSGVQLIKYWFSITDEEQRLRFLGRIHDPLKQWKLSPMDLESTSQAAAMDWSTCDAQENLHWPGRPISRSTRAPATTCRWTTGNGPSGESWTGCQLKPTT